MTRKLKKIKTLINKIEKIRTSYNSSRMNRKKLGEIIGKMNSDLYGLIKQLKASNSLK